MGTKTVGARVTYTARNGYACAGIITRELPLPAGLYSIMVHLDNGSLIAAPYSNLVVTA